MTNRSSLYGLLLWRVLLDLASRGTFFFVNIFIARALGVTDFGKFAYAISLSQIFYIFTDLGSHMLLIKELGEFRGSDKNRWIPFFQLKMILFAVSFIVYLCLIPFLWHWENKWVPMLAFFWMFSNSLLDFNQFVCNGLGRMDLAREIMFIQRAVMLSGVGFALFYFRTLEGVMTGLAVGGVLGTIFSNIIFQTRSGPIKIWGWNSGEWRRIFVDSIPLGVGNMFGSLYLRVGFVIMGWMCTAEVIGMYSAAFRVFEITYIVPAAVMSIGVPHLAEARRSGQTNFMNELRRISVIMAPAAVGWVLFLFFGGPLIIRTLYGDGYSEALPILRILSLVGGMVFLNYIVTHVMVVVEKQKRHAVHQLVVFCACTFLSFVLTLSLGAKGIAFAFLFAEVLLFSLTSLFLIHKEHLRSGE